MYGSAGGLKAQKIIVHHPRIYQPCLFQPKEANDKSASRDRLPID